MSRIHLTGASALVLASLFLVRPVHAQTAPPPVQVEEVTVTAGRGTALKALDVSTTTLNRVQVQQAPETSLDQIVNKIPGVFTSQQPAAQLHPTGQEFNIRGFGTTTNVNTLVMVDGIPANDPYFRTVDWNQVPNDAVDRLEVIRGGGASSLWGNMAMGGIVNVITRDPQPAEAAVDFSYGSFNTYTGDVSLGYAPIANLVLGLRYGIVKTDGYDQTPEAYRNPNMDATSSQTTNLMLSADFTPTDTMSFYLKFLDHRIAEDGLTYSIARNTWETNRVSGGGTIKLPGASSFNFNAWYGQGQMDTTNASNASYTLFTPQLGTPYVSQREAAKYDNVGGSAFVDSAWGPLKDIKGGVDFRVIAADDPLNLFSATAQTGAVEARARHAFEGVFLQGTYRAPAAPLDITLGLREDFWQASEGSIDGIYKGAAFSDTLSNQTYSHFDPRLGAKLYLPAGFDVRAASYLNFAAPGMNQMYRSFISGSSYTTSNPQLSPQTNTGGEVGFDYNHGPFTVSATAFDNSLKNFIDYATVQSGCASANNYCGTGIATIAGGALHQYVNAGDAVFRGYEVFGSWQVIAPVQLTASYTATSAYLTSSRYDTPSAGVIPDPINQQIGQVPPWLVTAGASWRVTDALEVSLQLKSFPSYWNNTSHTQKNGAATIADVGGSYHVNRRLDFYASIQNVGAARYYDQGLAFTKTDGSTVNATTIPALGLPFDLTVGARARF